jgi:hypothetical protein
VKRAARLVGRALHLEHHEELAKHEAQGKRDDRGRDAPQQAPLPLTHQRGHVRGRELDAVAPPDLEREAPLDVILHVIVEDRDGDERGQPDEHRVRQEDLRRVVGHPVWYGIGVAPMAMDRVP